jgi:protein-L-isoaspartate(D-aspartate) O-methyltransferase
MLPVQRINMVNSQVLPVGVTNHRVIAAMRAVPRRPFVPAAMKAFAHIDSHVRLNEANHVATPRYLMPPGPFAQLIQAAQIRPEDIVLDIGCATGYSSAVIARLANVVVALESDHQLAAFAIETLARLAIENVAVVTGPLEEGWPDAGPYDVIFIGGSVEVIPNSLMLQLSDGGRLVTVLGTGHAASAKLYMKSGSAFGERSIFNVAARPLPGFAKPKSFVF